MSATIRAATPAHIIRRKTVDTRQSGLNGGESMHPGAKTEQNGFADPKNLYITTLERAFSAAC
ncbi:hypothetical protein [uncultured Nitratireductor sp.]|uniref:hypothetical protein n=1 Tax=uncultured Nitratireductor sp. TaxID=520953 RepID=UPI0025D95534|nr:hypothetical protein [uncultured Nitratireductor sp.]